MTSYLEWFPTINNTSYNNNSVFYSSTASARPRQSMFGRWMSRVPKVEKYSLENLRQLGDILEQYTVDSYYDEKIVETIKEITQVLIWGDQHKPAILEYFFEQNMHYHFLRILETTKSPLVTKQLLQTMNILFENIHDLTSLYFLLSNNYVNRVICHEFDFSNDEILAYYIYFLRTLSFKLDTNTLYFFFNEHLDDFPLYSEAIKFFNAEESMIRVAVRTVTLNIFAVNDIQTQDFILNKKVAPYFSNLVYFIADHASTMNELSKEPYQNNHHSKISYYLAEHCDIFDYINDIINLDIKKINDVLTHHVIELLLKPFYADSLLREELLPPSEQQNVRISPIIALALLCHVLHIFRYPPLVTSMVAMLFSDIPHGLSYDTASSPEFTSSITTGSRNLYREAIFDCLTPDEESDDNEFFDLTTLPALCLIYMSCRNHAIAPDVLIGTGVYSQKLKITQNLMETQTSSSEDLLNELDDSQQISMESVSMASSATSASHEKTFFSDTNEKSEKSIGVLDNSDIHISDASHDVSSDKHTKNEHNDHISSYNNMVIPAIRIFSADDDSYVDVNIQNENNHNHIETLASSRVNYRRELISKLVLLLCEYYNRCRPITIQMATELLLELIYYNGAGESLSHEQTRMLSETESSLQEDMIYYFKEYPNFPLELVEKALRDSQFNGDKIVVSIIMDAKILFPPLPPVPPPPISITPSKTPPVESGKNYREDDDILRTIKTLHLIRQCRKLLSRQGRSSSDRMFDEEDRQDPDSNDDDETQQARLQNARASSPSSLTDDDEINLMQRKKECKC
ncbi:14038_t:CDS:10 [Ambispora leptoticha]|uniref:14038_t:CDS:1 n=1 Tax=Ambispora leptoticha TaxID=144679 RepID=A0A9N9EXB1_9GLOM|nr:14038_t:CDS:10 [Ambispora leptoticha]